MPQEIEVKLKVKNHEEIRTRLRALRAEHLGQVRETNIFFDRPNGSLRAADAGLRVRFSVSPDEPLPKALLTFKGPREKSGLRSREAFDVTLTPHDQIVPLLIALGYTQTLLFEKDRDSWKLDDCLIELDTLPALGTFLEVEGPSEESVRAVQTKLQLADLPNHHQGYSRMVANHLRKTARRTSLLFQI